MIAAGAQSAFLAAALPAWFRYRRALRDPERAQRRRLRAILAAGAGARFGRAHGLHAGLPYETFARRVPVQDWDAIDPAIDQICAGETGVLTGTPITRLVPTSGSTAAAKRVPWTDALQAEFSAAVRAWLADLYLRRPSLLAGPAYWAVSPAIDPPPIDSAVPIGHAADSAYVGGALAPLVAASMAVPPAVAQIRDHDAWRAATRTALLRCRGLRLISVWHPSFLESLLGEDVPAWPALGVISCWADGPAAPAAARLRERFPGVHLQPKGLLSTEGVVSIPYGGCLRPALTSHFLEFEDGAGAVHPAWAIPVGGALRPVLTTGGGLWRYRTGDLVRATRTTDGGVALAFLGRADAVCDLVGEKLSEGFVAACMLEVGIRGFAMLAPGSGGYTLYATAGDGPKWAARLDDALRANPQYAWARDAGQLSAVCAVAVDGNAATQVLERDVAEGRAVGHSKPQVLDRRCDWDRWFTGPCALSSESRKVPRMGQRRRKTSPSSHSR